MTTPKAVHARRPGLSLRQRQRRALRSEVLPARQTCVLIVVEHRSAGKTLAQMLTAKGYGRVRIVRRAASALLLAEECSPGIAFLDVALSDDAYELANLLRQHAGRRALRLIALTSKIEHSTREQARDAGFERWLVTPVAKDELDSLMHRVAAPE